MATNTEQKNTTCYGCSSNLGVHCIEQCSHEGRTMVSSRTKAIVHTFPADISECNLAETAIQSETSNIEDLPLEEIGLEQEWEDPQSWQSDAIPLALLFRSFGLISQRDIEVIQRALSSQQQTEEAIRMIRRAILTREDEKLDPTAESDLRGADSEDRVFESLFALPDVFIPESIERSTRNSQLDFSKVDIVAHVQAPFVDLLRGEEVRIQVKSSSKKIEEFLTDSLSLKRMRKRHDIRLNLVQGNWLIENGQHHPEIIQVSAISQLAGLIQYRNRDRYDLNDIQRQYWTQLDPSIRALVDSHKHQIEDELAFIFSAYDVSSKFLSTVSRGHRKSATNSHLFKRGQFVFDKKLLDQAQAVIDRVFAVNETIPYTYSTTSDIYSGNTSRFGLSLQ